jgi:hypothetical protein
VKQQADEKSLKPGLEYSILTAAYPLLTKRRAKILIGSFLVCCSLLIAAPSANAIPVLLIQTPPSEPANSGDGTIGSWLVGVVNNYNTAHGTAYPTFGIGSTPNLKVNLGDASPGSGYPGFGSGTLSINLNTGDFDYVVFHWGGDTGNSYQAYYLGNEADHSLYTFTAPGNNGLSFYSFYEPNGTQGVPEAGATAGLLGLGLFAIGAFKKSRSQQP